MRSPALLCTYVFQRSYQASRGLPRRQDHSLAPSVLETLVLQTGGFSWAWGGICHRTQVPTPRCPPGHECYSHPGLQASGVWGGLRGQASRKRPGLAEVGPRSGDKAGCRKEPPRALFVKTWFPGLVALASPGSWLDCRVSGHGAAESIGASAASCHASSRAMWPWPPWTSRWAASGPPGRTTELAVGIPRPGGHLLPLGPSTPHRTPSPGPSCPSAGSGRASRLRNIQPKPL